MVKGSVALAGNDIRMTPDTPLLAAAKGRVDFSQRGFTVSAASARALGGELVFEGGSSAGLNGGDSQRFSGRGTATAEALRQASELGTLARVAQSLSGQTSYRATLAFVAGRPQISVASNLVGLAIELPAPLAKAAATPLALRVRTGPEDGTTVPVDGAAAFREALQVDLGGTLQAHFVREVSGDAARVVRGAIRVGEPRGERFVEPTPGDALEALALPASGVAANVTLRSASMSKMPGRRRSRVCRASPRGPAPARRRRRWSSTPPAAPATSPTRSRCASASWRSARAVSTTSRPACRNRPSSGAPTSAPTSSTATSSTGRRGAGPSAGRVFARLSRLSLPKGEVERVESLLDEQPATIPALDVVVDDFELRGKRLGRLEIEATNRGAGGRGARVAARQAQPDDAGGAARGDRHLGRRGRQRAAACGDELHARARRQRRAARAARHGPRRPRRQGLAHRRRLAWPGSPFSPDYAKMTGQVKVAIDSGQFLKAGPGAARLLSVLSLQSLPRRLLFDFRDLFAEGFAFDSVVGDVKIGRRARRRPTTCACAAPPRRC